MNLELTFHYLNFYLPQEPGPCVEYHGTLAIDH